MKKVIAVVLAVVLALTLCACSSNTEPEGGTATATAITTKPTETAPSRYLENGVAIDSTVFPINTVLKVEPVAQEDPKLQTVTATLEGVQAAVGYEITATADAVSVQPDGTVEVLFPIPVTYDSSKHDLAVYYVADDGTLGPVPATVGATAISATLSHFSTYVVVLTAKTEPAVTEANTTTVTTATTTAAATTAATTAAVTTTATVTKATIPTTVAATKPTTAVTQPTTPPVQRTMVYDIYYNDGQGQYLMFYVFMDDMTKAEWYGYNDVVWTCGCEVGTNWDVDWIAKTVTCPCGRATLSNPAVFTNLFEMEQCRHIGAAFLGNGDNTHVFLCGDCFEIHGLSMCVYDGDKDGVCDECETKIRTDISYARYNGTYSAAFPTGDGFVISMTLENNTLIANNLYDPNTATSVDNQNLYTIAIHNGVIATYFDSEKNSDDRWGFVDNTHKVYDIEKLTISDTALTATITYQGITYYDINLEKQ